MLALQLYDPFYILSFSLIVFLLRIILLSASELKGVSLLLRPRQKSLIMDCTEPLGRYFSSIHQNPSPLDPLITYRSRNPAFFQYYLSSPLLILYISIHSRFSSNQFLSFFPTGNTTKERLSSISNYILQILLFLLLLLENVTTLYMGYRAYLVTICITTLGKCLTYYKLVSDVYSPSETLSQNR